MTREEELKNEIAEHIGLFIRIKAILDDEDFWKVDNDGAWHSSLHRDLSKVCNKSKKLNDRLSIYHKMIKTLQEKIDDFESRTCSTCRYLDKASGRCTDLNTNVYQMYIDNPFDFSCNKWEKK